MAQVTKQNLSHSEVDSDEFVPFSEAKFEESAKPDEDRSSNEDTSVEAISSDETHEPAFTVGDSFWEVLKSDSVMASEIDRLVNEKVEARLLADITAEKAEVFEKEREKAKKEGFEQGMNEGIEAGKSISNVAVLQLKKMCEKLVNDHGALLHRHEKIWSQSMLRLLKRFMVPKAEDVVHRVSEWMRETVEGISESDRVQIHIPPEAYDCVSRLEQVDGNPWTWVSDPSLELGEVKVDTAMGGIFFSQKEQWNELNKILDDYFRTDDV